MVNLSVSDEKQHCDPAVQMCEIVTFLVMDNFEQDLTSLLHKGQDWLIGATLSRKLRSVTPGNCCSSFLFFWKQIQNFEIFSIAEEWKT